MGAALNRSGVRELVHVTPGLPASDGDGVRMTRIIGTPELNMLDPFLLLDAFGSDQPQDYIGGFPSHPHRGFETVTYLLAGRMRHKDNAGNEGVIEPGGVQWMTAGRGVIHSEIPQQEAGVMEGFQLWLNLPARDKMCPPWYRDFAAADLPRFATAEGVAVTVIAGASHGVAGAVTREATEPLVLDLWLEAGACFEQPLPPGHDAFVVVYRGAATVGETPLSPGKLAILANDPAADGVVIEAKDGAKVLLVAGRPLGEPIAQYGPFVMNTEEEIYQAVSDFRDGRLG